MNKLLTAIKLALFGSNVEAIVSSFKAHEAKLKQLAERLIDHSDAKREQADRLLDEAHDHRQEADRALRVAQRIGELVR